MTSLLLDGTAQMVFPQAPTPCLTKLNERPWHNTLAVSVGDWHVGIRVDTAQTERLVQQLLEPVRRPELDRVVEPNFSLELRHESGASTGPGRLQIVYRDHNVVARRRDVQEVLTDLVELLDDVPRVMAASKPVLNCVAVLCPDDHVILVPSTVHTELLTRRRQLEASGIAILSHRAHILDAAAGTVEGAFADDSLAAIAALRGADARSFPVRAWCLPAVGDEVFELDAVHSVFVGFSAVLNRSVVGSRGVLEAMRAMTERTTFVGLPEMHSHRLASTLAALSTR